MRFDEINIIGEFKINGLTGSPGQALGLSGSDFTWITVSASSIIDAVGLTGTDYVICQSVNTGNPGADAIENGNRLKSAYATASGLYVSNRVSVLITPGDYDFGANPLQLTTTKVDLIGLSSDASDVILRGSGDYVLQLDANIDTALYNVTLGTSSLFSVYNDGNTGDYLRWNNVIAIGNMFSDDNTSYESLNGEFKNIKVYNSPFAFYTLNGDIDGTYDNIELIDVDYGFYSNVSLLGTYSNIFFGGTTVDCFVGGGEINASFENINVASVSNIFIGYGISGVFRNIQIGNVDGSILSSSSVLDGIFDNIKIGNIPSGGAFVATSANLSGTFSNIEIMSGATVFKSYTSGSIIGQFQNITIGNAAEVFSSATDISGFFKNIEVGDCVVEVLFSSNTTDGIFDNIKTGNSDSLFYTNNGLSGTFSNIKLGDVNAVFYSANSSINGYFENISGGNLGSLGGFQSVGNISGYYKNINFGNILDGFLYSTAGKLDGIYDEIKLGNITGNYLFFSYGTMSGTFSNIEVGNMNTPSSAFYSYTSLTGRYQNIKIGNCQSSFGAALNNVNGYFDTIEIGDVSLGSFVPSSNLLGTYKNISISSGSGASLFFSNTTNGIFDNIKVINSNTINNFFYSSDYLIGTFSNIEANGQITNAFSAFTTVYGDYKNLTLGTVSTLFNSVDILAVTAIIDNLKANSYLSNFAGKITNSTIDARGLSSSAISITSTLDAPTIIERCKFLSDSEYITIDSLLDPNAQISFTITNYGITSSITNDIDTPLNIDNPNIT